MNKTGRPPQNQEAKFLKYRKIEGDHWLWTGRIEKNGYGRARFRGKIYSVHQISACLYLGYQLGHRDPKYQVNHKCDLKHCFNPDHLYIGSQSQNMLDAVKDGYQPELNIPRRKISWS